MCSPTRWPLALLLGLAAANLATAQPLPLHIKVEFDPKLVDFEDPDARFKEVAARVIAGIVEKGYSRFFNWQLVPMPPSDRSYPELRVAVQLDNDNDNWAMNVMLKTGDAPAVPVPLPTKYLLKPGDLAAGTFPAGTGRRQRVAEWFMEYFVEPQGDGALSTVLSQNVPLAKVYLRLPTQPPLQPNQGLLLLPFSNYQHLGKSQFKMVVWDQMQTFEFGPFEGRQGYRTCMPPGQQQIEAMLLEYLGQAPVPAGIQTGFMYVTKFVDSVTLPPGSQLSITDK